MSIENTNLQALLLGTGRFYFCEGAKTVTEALAKGFLDFGNLKSVGIKTENEKIEHESASRGAVTIDKTVIRKAKLQYSLKADEWNKDNVSLAFYGEAGSQIVQAAHSAAAGDDLEFSVGNPSKSDRWYDARIGGAIVRHVTTITMTGLTEGEDFELDKELGRIRFLTAQTSTVTPTITSTAITSTSPKALNSLTPLVNVQKSGIGRLLFWDDNEESLKLDHSDFGCDVYIDSADEVDGSKFAEMTITVQVTSPKGTLASRD